MKMRCVKRILVGVVVTCLCITSVDATTLVNALASEAEVEVSQVSENTTTEDSSVDDEIIATENNETEESEESATKNEDIKESATENADKKEVATEKESIEESATENEDTEESVAENENTDESETITEESEVDTEESTENAKEESADVINSEEIVGFTPVSGMAGESAWNIDADGKLTVSGATFNCTPWDTYKKSILSIEIDSKPVGDVTLSNMFTDYYNVTSIVFGYRFDTSGFTDMSKMFNECNRLKAIDISRFDTSSVESFAEMFRACLNLTDINLGNMDTSSVTDMSGMFRRCCKLKEVDVSGFDTSSVTDMSGMFCDCSALEELDVSGFDTSEVTTFLNMFFNCSTLEYIDVSNFDTSNTETFEGMFIGCEELKTIDVTGFDTSQAYSFNCMFCSCFSLESLDVSSFDTSNAIDMSHMFSDCSALKQLDISSMRTPKLERATCMFENIGLTYLNMENLDFKKVTYASNLINYSDNLRVVISPKNVGAHYGISLITVDNPEKWICDGVEVTAFMQSAASKEYRVRNWLPDRLSVGPTNVKIEIGESSRLLASYENAIWSSGNPEIATIDSKGKVKALKTGIAIMSANCIVDGVKIIVLYIRTILMQRPKIQKKLR